MRPLASEYAETRPAWAVQPSRYAQLAAYSVLRKSPAFAVLAIAIGCAENFADPDLWMHILVGLETLHTGHIPYRDVYSYSAAGSAWRNHEWLAQVVIALAYAGLGIIGLKLWKLFCTTVVVLAIATGLAQTAAPPAVQRVLVLAVAAGLATQMQFRPQLFTFAMLSILTATLAQDTYGKRVRLWPLIPMFTLWANLHGGFVIGLFVLATYSMILALRELLLTGKILHARATSAVTIGCALATLINPLGLQLWLQVAHSVTDPALRLFNRDWLPLHESILAHVQDAPLANLSFAVPIVLFASFLAAVIIAPSLEDAPLVLVAFFLIGMAFYSTRNVALAIIALIHPLAYHLGLRLSRLPRADRRRGVADRSPILIIGLAMFIAVADGSFSSRLRTWEPVPSGALCFMSVHGLRGNILNDFEAPVSKLAP